LHCVALESVCCRKDIAHGAMTRSVCDGQVKPYAAWVKLPWSAGVSALRLCHAGFGMELGIARQ
jgi:hypothetical protein